MSKTFKIRVGGSKSQTKNDLKKFEREVSREMNKQVDKLIKKLSKHHNLNFSSFRCGYI